MKNEEKQDESADDEGDGRAEVAVPERFREVLAVAEQEVSRTLRELGAAQIEHEDAKARYEEADRRLRAASSLAREALSLQQQNLLEASKALRLDDGTWSYDTLEGKMLRKDIDDG